MATFITILCHEGVKGAHKPLSNTRYPLLSPLKIAQHPGVDSVRLWSIDLDFEDALKGSC